ncbi:MAG: hypothetical protein ACYCXG_02905 [Acidiferrobacter sp.]
MAFDVGAVVPIRTVDKQIDARCYNRARLAMARLGEPLEIVIAALRVRMTLESRVWVARSLVNDTLLMAWAEFDHRRCALHEPVSCHLHLYHFHAGLLMGRVPLMLETLLEDCLARAPRHPRGECVPAPRPRRPR